MVVVPTSAVIRDCIINSTYKFLVGFHMGKQVQILAGDVLHSKADTFMREKNWQ